jgi:transcription elongation factor GreB
VSKAFTKDDDGGAELLVVPRAPLPPGFPNYVTPRGLALLRAEQESIDAERAGWEVGDAPDRLARLNALSQRALDLQGRLADARVVEPDAQPRDQVRFGASVRVRHASRKVSEYRLVGVDEADAARGLLAFSSPLGRALLGKRVGEVLEFRTPRASDELEVLAIDYGSVLDPTNAGK